MGNNRLLALEIQNRIIGKINRIIGTPLIQLQLAESVIIGQVEKAGHERKRTRMQIRDVMVHSDSGPISRYR